jgi:pimeloyl-ACP methyl ester carboxylesterase
VNRIKTSFITIDGLKIRYAQGGSNHGHPVLLLSPWPESILAYTPTWEIFQALGPVVAVDLPGFGHSQSRPELMAPEPMGDFLVEIVKAFKLSRPHVVGPDVGTPAVLFAASKYPDLFRSCIIGSGATDHTDLGGGLDLIVNSPAFMEEFKNWTGERFVRGAMERITKYRLPEEILGDYIESYSGKRLLESAQFVRNYPSHLPRLPQRLALIQTPCQIVAGKDDPLVRVSNAMGLHRGIPINKLDLLNCGHYAWEDEAAEYGRICSEWISGGYEKLLKESR